MLKWAESPRMARRPWPKSPHVILAHAQCVVNNTFGGATMRLGGVRVPGGLHRLQSGWDERSSSGGFDSRPPPPTTPRSGPSSVGETVPRLERCSGRATRPRCVRPRCVLRARAASRLRSASSAEATLIATMMVCRRSTPSHLLASRAHVANADIDVPWVAEAPCWNTGIMRRQGASREPARNAASSSSPGRTCA